VAFLKRLQKKSDGLVLVRSLRTAFVHSAGSCARCGIRRWTHTCTLSTIPSPDDNRSRSRRPNPKCVEPTASFVERRLRTTLFTLQGTATGASIHDAGAVGKASSNAQSLQLPTSRPRPAREQGAPLTRLT